MAKSHACSSPDHHVHDAAGFVTAVERACSERRYGWSPNTFHTVRAQ